MDRRIRWLGAEPYYECSAPLIHTRAMPPGWLAITSRGGAGTMLAVADDVRRQDIAAIGLHMRREHDGPGVMVCRSRTCDEVDRWRPAATPVIASSA